MYSTSSYFTNHELCKSVIDALKGLSSEVFTQTEVSPAQHFNKSISNSLRTIQKSFQRRCITNIAISTFLYYSRDPSLDAFASAVNRILVLLDSSLDGIYSQSMSINQHSILILLNKTVLHRNIISWLFDLLAPNELKLVDSIIETSGDPLSPQQLEIFEKYSLGESWADFPERWDLMLLLSMKLELALSTVARVQFQTPLQLFHQDTKYKSRIHHDCLRSIIFFYICSQLYQPLMESEITHVIQQYTNKATMNVSKSLSEMWDIMKFFLSTSIEELWKYENSQTAVYFDHTVYGSLCNIFKNMVIGVHLVYSRKQLLSQERTSQYTNTDQMTMEVMENLMLNSSSQVLKWKLFEFMNPFANRFHVTDENKQSIESVDSQLKQVMESGLRQFQMIETVLVAHEATKRHDTVESLDEKVIKEKFSHEIPPALPVPERENKILMRKRKELEEENALNPNLNETDVKITSMPLNVEKVVSAEVVEQAKETLIRKYSSKFEEIEMKKMKARWQIRRLKRLPVARKALKELYEHDLRTKFTPSKDLLIYNAEPYSIPEPVNAESNQKTTHEDTQNPEALSAMLGINAENKEEEDELPNTSQIISLEDEEELGERPLADTNNAIQNEANDIGSTIEIEVDDASEITSPSYSVAQFTPLSQFAPAYDTDKLKNIFSEAVKDVTNQETIEQNKENVDVQNQGNQVQAQNQAETMMIKHSTYKTDYGIKDDRMLTIAKALVENIDLMESNQFNNFSAFQDLSASLELMLLLLGHDLKSIEPIINKTKLLTSQSIVMNRYNWLHTLLTQNPWKLSSSGVLPLLLMQYQRVQYNVHDLVFQYNKQLMRHIIEKSSILSHLLIVQECFLMSGKTNFLMEVCTLNLKSLFPKYYQLDSYYRPLIHKYYSSSNKLTEEDPNVAYPSCPWKKDHVTLYDLEIWNTEHVQAAILLYFKLYIHQHNKEFANNAKFAHFQMSSVLLNAHTYNQHLALLSSPPDAIKIDSIMADGENAEENNRKDHANESEGNDQIEESQDDAHEVISRSVSNRIQSLEETLQRFQAPVGIPSSSSGATSQAKDYLPSQYFYFQTIHRTQELWYHFLSGKALQYLEISYVPKDKIIQGLFADLQFLPLITMFTRRYFEIHQLMQGHQMLWKDIQRLSNRIRSFRFSTLHVTEAHLPKIISTEAVLRAMHIYFYQLGNMLNCFLQYYNHRIMIVNQQLCAFLTATSTQGLEYMLHCVHNYAKELSIASFQFSEEEARVLKGLTPLQIEELQKHLNALSWLKWCVNDFLDECRHLLAYFYAIFIPFVIVEGDILRQAASPEFIVKKLYESIPIIQEKIKAMEEKKRRLVKHAESIYDGGHPTIAKVSLKGHIDSLMMYLQPDKYL